MNHNESIVRHGGNGLSAIQTIGETVWGYPVLEDKWLLEAKKNLLSIFKKQEIGASDNQMFLLSVRIDDGYQKIKSNNHKFEVQMHHALKVSKRLKEGGDDDYENMEGLGDYVEIEMEGGPRTFVTSKNGSLKLRDIETGYTYVMTPEGLIGPFEYGCGIFQADVDGGLEDKATFVIPYTKHGGLDEDAKVYNWTSE